MRSKEGERGSVLIKLPPLRPFGLPFSFFLLSVGIFGFGVYTLILFLFLLDFTLLCEAKQKKTSDYRGTYVYIQNSKGIRRILLRTPPPPPLDPSPLTPE